jgi:hypothetical protein
VAEGCLRTGAGPTVKLSPRQSAEFLSVGCTGEGCKLTATEENATVTGRGQTWTCKVVEAASKSGTTEFVYRGWLTREVPFGWARLNTITTAGGQEQGQFTATLVRAGTGARGELEIK